VKLKFEVLFNKFHPRINLTTLFLTKTYLLNTMKPFSGHYFGSKQQNLKKKEPEFAGHQVGPNESGSQNLSFLDLMV
jgi:hypothetical protein